jgi:transposase
MADKPEGLGEFDSASADVQRGIDQFAGMDAQIRALSEKIQAEHETNAAEAQADMIQLQTLVAKRNEALEMLSSSVKRQSDTAAAIVRNLG